MLLFVFTPSQLRHTPILERIDGNIIEPHLEETKHHKTKKDTYLGR